MNGFPSRLCWDNLFDVPVSFVHIFALRIYVLSASTIHYYCADREARLKFSGRSKKYRVQGYASSGAVVIRLFGLFAKDVIQSFCKADLKLGSVQTGGAPSCCTRTEAPRDERLLKHSSTTKVTNMNNFHEERSRYKIIRSHRNQTFSAIVSKDRNTYAWTWHGHIDFTDGQHFEFSSQRNFPTATEAEDYMCRFICDRIDSQLSR
jgi:hypothetical protein